MQQKGHRFNTIAEIQSESQNIHDSLMENDFRVEFQEWQEHWDRCIFAQSDYFVDVNILVFF